MQTNETRTAILHYLRSANGTITEVERIPTGGSGSGVFRPIYEANGPNAFEGAPDGREGSILIPQDVEIFTMRCSRPVKRSLIRWHRQELGPGRAGRSRGQRQACGRRRLSRIEGEPALTVTPSLTFSPRPADFGPRYVLCHHGL
jgi:hypothetical protein